MSDIGYRIKVYSNIRYNVGLCSLQSDIGSSDIKLSPIWLVTDIGVSAHPWYFLLLSSTWSGYLPSTPVEGVVGRTMGQQSPNRPGWSAIIPAERGRGIYGGGEEGWCRSTGNDLCCSPIQVGVAGRDPSLQEEKRSFHQKVSSQVNISCFHHVPMS
jgi:hypothetical protein